MPFVQHKVDNSASAGVSGLSVALKKGKRDLVARMFVYLTEKVSVELDWPIGSVLEVQIGTETDHGLLRLRKNDSAIGGAKVVRAGKGKFARIEVALGFIPGFVDRDEPKQPCPYEDIGDGGTIEIVLPAWAEETHPTKPKVSLPPARPAAPVVTAKPRPLLGQRMTTVPTFGDPPRSRSALVAGAAQRMEEQKRLKLAEEEAVRESRAARQSNASPPEEGKPGKLAPAMIRILDRLLDGEVHTIEDLFGAMGSKASSTQIVRTTVSLSKAALRSRGIVLKSISGVGYQLDAGSNEAAKRAVVEAQQEIAA